MIIIVGSIPTLPPLAKKFVRSRYGRGNGSPWPTQKQYTHPMDDTVFDTCPLRDQNTSTSITVVGLEHYPKSHTIDEVHNTRSSIEENDIGGIHKTTEFNVEYETK